jgi:hypothetical protein
LANWMHSKSLIWEGVRTWKNYLHLLTNWINSKSFICESVQLLYWYIIQSTFQLGGQLSNIPNINNVSQVEHPTMLINNVKHVSTKEPFSKHFWHLRFFNWHIIKTLISV